ncbi:MAG TPA: homocysteine S-methyltransferase family protein [Gemmatimonadaceae bacterium]|nr:homocysteine S-methyltransferase family protein [Gemmatimonadaceae bacterium]
MKSYRKRLPQLGDRLFLTDGGLETTLIFLEGLELPDFAAFHLLKTPEGEAALKKYFRTYADIALKYGTGLILESATWRANRDWGMKLGYSESELADANRSAIRILEEVRAEIETDSVPVVISGCLGPRGDGYIPGKAMSEQEAEEYHREQVEIFAATAADLVCAITMNYAEEAIGIARAAKAARMPAAISFTVETDGTLPTGQTLKKAIEQVEAATSGYPSYYMINCAHPTHFESVLASKEAWLNKIRGIRANASRMSHAELNEAPVLDAGDPRELAREYAEISRRMKHINIMGGCCGTDHRHIEQIASTCSPLFQAAPTSAA